MEKIFSAPEKIMLGVVIIVGGYFLARFARASLKKAMGVFEWSGQVGSLITTVYYAILVLSIMTGMATMGVNITPIIAALGLGGFALGFALRDPISSVLAGLLIIIFHPFSKGDYISIAGSEGKVEEINLRYTVLDNGEGDRVLIPNKMIFTNPVKVKKQK